MQNILCVLLFIFLSAGWDCAYSLPLSSTRYDEAIERAVRRYWTMCYRDPMLWKAQLYQESHLEPMATSPAGAAGIAQFMPDTWEDTIKQLGISGASVQSAGPAIEAGAYYMERMCRNWTSPRPIIDRHDLALASYNAGLGNILKAQRKCDGALRYSKIIICLESITGQNSQETISYVDRIHTWWIRLKLRIP